MLVRRLDPELFAREIVEQFKRIMEVAKNNVLVGVKKRLNFVDSDTVTWTIADNPGTKSIDISASSAGSGGLSDGDYGDVTVSGSGTVITVDNNAITDVKLRDSAALSVIGRSANSVGDPADIAGASPGDVLRVAGAPPVLGFGNIPESSVTNLITDLAGKVPTSRLINTGSPLTGGGDLSADLTLDLDETVAIGNNARVKVSKAGSGVGVRREINFIEGSGVTLGIVDDSGSEKVDVTVSASGSGLATGNIVITVPYVSYQYKVNVLDASVGVASKILVWRATTAPTDPNDFPVGWLVNETKVGSFDISVYTLDNQPLGGDFTFHYSVL